MSSKDDNGMPILYGVSHIDGVTPIAVAFDPTTRVMSVDSVTTIIFNASINATQTVNGYPLAKATSSVDNVTVKPWVVNASTGAVLVDIA